MVGRFIIEKWPKISGCVGCCDPKSEWKCKLVGPHELHKAKIWGHFGPNWDLFRANLCHFGPISAILGLFATYLGLIKAYLGHYGPIWSRFWSIGPIWSQFGPFWTKSGPIWAIWDPNRAYLSHFGPYWVILGLTGAYLGLIRPRKNYVHEGYLQEFFLYLGYVLTDRAGVLEK